MGLTKVRKGPLALLFACLLPFSQAASPQGATQPLHESHETHLRQQASELPQIDTDLASNEPVSGSDSETDTELQEEAPRLSSPFRGPAQIVPETDVDDAIVALTKDPQAWKQLFRAGLAYNNIRCLEIIEELDTLSGSDNDNLDNLEARLANFSNPNERDLAVGRELAEFCFERPLSDLGHPLADWLGKRAAIIDTPSGHCSALLIDSRKVATARHCLQDRGAFFSLAQVSVIALAEATLVRRTVAADPAYAVGTRFTPQPTVVQSDFIVLDLTTSIPQMERETTSFASLDELRSLSLSYEAKFYQVGFQKLASLQSLAAKDSIEYFRDAYVADATAYCRPIQVTETCVIQGCQSLAQTSGAAMIVQSQGKPPQVVGTLFGGGQPNAARTACFKNEQEAKLIADKKTRINYTSRAR